MAQAQEKLTVRKSVLLRPSEEQRMNELARSRGLSFGELARVAIDYYEHQTHLEPDNEEAIIELIDELNSRLDDTHKQVNSALRKVKKLESL